MKQMNCVSCGGKIIADAENRGSYICVSCGNSYKEEELNVNIRINEPVSVVTSDSTLKSMIARVEAMYRVENDKDGLEVAKQLKIHYPEHYSGYFYTLKINLRAMIRDNKLRHEGYLYNYRVFEEDYRLLTNNLKVYPTSELTVEMVESLVYEKMNAVYDGVMSGNIKFDDSEFSNLRRTEGAAPVISRIMRDAARSAKRFDNVNIRFIWDGEEMAAVYAPSGCRYLKDLYLFGNRLVFSAGGYHSVKIKKKYLDFSIENLADFVGRETWDEAKRTGKCPCCGDDLSGIFGKRVCLNSNCNFVIRRKVK